MLTLGPSFDLTLSSGRVINVEFSFGDGGIVRRMGAGNHIVRTPYVVSVHCEIRGITPQKGVVLMGDAYCSTLDRFIVTKGCEKALGRALWIKNDDKTPAVGKSDRLEIWSAWFKKVDGVKRAQEGLSKGRQRIVVPAKQQEPAPTP